MRKLDFILFGARKCATTSIGRCLGEHPDVFLMPRTRYFQKNLYLKLGKSEVERRISLLCKDARDGQIVGEVASGYIHDTSSAENIREYSPGIKLLVVLRNPIDRTYSEYMMQKRDGRERRSFSAHLYPGNHYVRNSRYFYLLKKYYEQFDKKQIEVYLYEDFCLNPNFVIKDMFRFLEVDDSFIPCMGKKMQVGKDPRSVKIARLLNVKNPVRESFAVLLRRFLSLDVRQNIRRAMNRINQRDIAPLNEDQRAVLRNIFKDDVANLEKLVGRDLSVWGIK